MLRKLSVVAVTLHFVIATGLAFAADSLPDDWDLDAIYPDERSWQLERDSILATVAKIDAKRNEPIGDADMLAEVLALVADARSRAGKMAMVGLLQASIDGRSVQARHRRDTGLELEREVEQVAEFLPIAVRNIGEETVRSWMAENSSLRAHERRINRIFRLAPYSPDPNVDCSTRDLMKLSRLSNALYNQLLESDIGWPSLDDDTAKRLDPAGYRRLSNSPEPAVRRAAARGYLTHLQELSPVFGTLLIARIEAERDLAACRKLDNSIDHLLVLNDAMPAESFQVLFAELQRARPLVHRAARALQNAYEMDRLSLEDLNFRPMVSDATFPLARTESIVLRSVDKLGHDYRELLQSRLDLPWFHLAPMEHKDAGGGVFWQVGGGHPYVYFTYRNDFSSARRYAGAALLMMGYASVPDATAPDRREEDLPVFSNALWYLGRFLFYEEFADVIDDEKERIGILAFRIAESLYQLFQNSLVTQLEVEINQLIDEGAVVDGAEISRRYGRLLEKYYGGGPIVIEDYHHTAWITHGTFFYGPHHTAWAQAFAAALALKNRIDAGDERAINAVRDGIGRSSTHFSHDVLREAGVDVTSVETIRAAIDEIRKMVRDLELALHTAGSTTVPENAGDTAMNDFSFLTRMRTIRHRRLAQSMANSADWKSFETGYAAWNLLDGAASVDRVFGEMDGKPFEGVSVRSLDRESGIWTIYWMDVWNPRLREQVRGSFDGGVGTFYGTEAYRDETYRMRFLWRDITETSARWEQAYQDPRTGHWETNWLMDFSATD